MKEWMNWKDASLLAFGCFAAFVDGLVIAQAWDWLVNAHRMSLWILL